MADAGKNRQLVEQAMKTGMALHVTMGVAADENMNYRPWHGYIFPSGFSKSRQGERVDCTLEPAERYYVTGASQTAGAKKLLLDDFEVIELVNRRPPSDDSGLYIRIHTGEAKQ